MPYRRIQTHEGLSIKELEKSKSRNKGILGKGTRNGGQFSTYQENFGNSYS